MEASQNKQTEQQGAASSRRPDPAFSYVMTILARLLNLEILNVKLPQTLIADFIIAVPSARIRELKETILDFLRDINIFEFKGEHDTFDEREFIKNRVRTDLVFLEHEEASFENLLNVIVTARWPTRFFNYMLERGYKFEPVLGRSWLRRCNIGLQEVVVVICNLLPVEPKYGEWLLFAPTDQPKWRDAVRMFAKERNWRLLDLARDLNKVRFASMTPELKEIFLTYGSEDRDRFIREQREAFNAMAFALKETDPEGLQEVLREFAPEERLAGLDPQERLAGLKPEERLAGLKPEELEQIAKLVEERKRKAKSN